MAKFVFQVRSPIALIEWPSESSEKDIRSFYDEFGAALQQGRIRAEIWDLTHVNPIITSASQRRFIAECVKEIAPFLKGNVLAAGRVVPNGLIRGVVTAVDWLTGNYEHPVQNFATHTEAEKFVLDKLREARVHVPEASHFHTAAWTDMRVASPRR